MWQKTKHIFGSIGRGIGTVCAFFFRFRKFFLAIPVMAAAGYLAYYSWINLPDAVGLILNARGQFTLYLTKNVAIWGPFGITMTCLLLMALSRKVLYPWLVSIVSMVLPILSLILNSFVNW